jgi:ketosteroid isomerase-like protein
MSQENVEVARRGFATWEQGDFGAHLRLIHEDVVCCRVAPLINPKTYHGLDGYLEFASDWIEPYEVFEFQPSEYIDAGDRVVVEVPVQGRLAGSDHVMKGMFWFLFHPPRWKGGPDRDLRRPRPGPRSRRAAGVGDVGGERGVDLPRE